MMTILRLGILAGATLLLSFCFLFSNEKTIFDKLQIEQMTIYTSSRNIFAESNIQELRTQIPILSGNGYAFACSTENYLKIKNNSEIDGITFESKLNADEIMNALNAKLLSHQIITDTETEKRIEIYYCFLENLTDHILVDNKKVNLQIAFNGERSIIGLPLILGSY